jgi:cysteinyl-tRNA synthetase
MSHFPTLQVIDTLTKDTIEISANNQTIKMYVCGVTPYDYAHLGHGRCYVTFDLLLRLLKFLGHEVIYCRNFTDIDDKLLDRAEKELGDRLQYHVLAQKFIDAYHKDVAQLNCLAPTYEPRVTEYIPAIIMFIQELINSNKAYISNGDVYFRVQSFSEYGKLSKRKLEDLHAGARVEVSEKKENPLDFALWKNEQNGGFWDSPWGNGRPGWHIECSVMASVLLGNHIDIHGGGMDLIFPHHENEIAQSESIHGSPFSRIWMHNAFVRINQEKMSKSLGNFFTLRDIFNTVDPMVMRFYFVSHNYTAPLDFTHDDVHNMRKAYQRVCKALEHYVTKKYDQLTQAHLLESSIVREMLACLCNDLNGSGAIGILFEHLKIAQENEFEGLRVKAFCQRVLGLTLNPLISDEVVITPEIQALIDERLAARVERDWKRSDELRDILAAMGVQVSDQAVKKN